MAAGRGGAGVLYNFIIHISLWRDWTRRRDFQTLS
jgi:hypothetical protein